ncbi:MAG TPA: zinc metalloprotease HtpX [Chloroflexota bacterium]|jgi:heat shock protein HtpX|nr:zinc metalloprotease HtpX [Chloroflexota bacterium]
MSGFFKTALLLTALTVLLVLVGRALAGTAGMLAMLAVALVMNFLSYWFSDKIVLAMNGARPVSQLEAPELYALVADVARQARLPMPRVYIVDSPTPNAFATGRDPAHAAVAVTTGILELLTPRELRAVLAHELGHVRNRDTLIMTVVAVIAGAIVSIAHMAQWALFFGGYGGHRDDDSGPNPLAALLMILLAPLAATLIQLAISRTREYEADATGARLSGDPLALASALEKLERGVSLRPMPNANPATASLYIVNPLSGDFIASLFSTHPPIPERIARLRAMAMQRSYGAVA